MPRKVAKSPSATQTGPLPPMPRSQSFFPLSNSVFRAYFMTNTPQPEDPYDRSVLSPHYGQELEAAKTLVAPISVAIAVPRTVPELQTEVSLRKREVVFTSQSDSMKTSPENALTKGLIKPRTAMSQSRLGVRKGDRPGLLPWVQQYFKFPEKDKKPFRRKTTLQPNPSAFTLDASESSLQKSFMTVGTSAKSQSKSGLLRRNLAGSAFKSYAK